MRRFVQGAGLALVAALVCAATLAAAQTPGWPKSLKGHLLVAEPTMGDPNFDHTVVFMVEHDHQGAFGIVVNRSYGLVPLAELMSGFGVDEAPAEDRVEVMYGGPVSPELGMVLHSNDYATDGTRTVTTTLSFTTNVKVLEDIAGGRGPSKSLLVMGYAGWAPGQLESEIDRGDWFWVPADSEMVLSQRHKDKWQAAMDLRGTDL